jgi:uncharacterized membrane protein YkvA (DUF1232 family)
MTWRHILVTGLLVLLYLRSPIDLLPDRIGPLGLLDDLIVLLGFIWWARRQLGHAASRPARERPAVSTDEPWNPYAVLGISRGASHEEILHAYREQMKRYHPDRVADLGEEMQQLAHRKTVEIQRAYGELGKPQR